MPTKSYTIQQLATIHEKEVGHSEARNYLVLS